MIYVCSTGCARGLAPVTIAYANCEFETRGVYLILHEFNQFLNTFCAAQLPSTDHIERLITLSHWDRRRHSFSPRVVPPMGLVPLLPSPFNGHVVALPPFGVPSLRMLGMGQGATSVSFSRDWHWRQENELCGIITTKNVTPIDRRQHGQRQRQRDWPRSGQGQDRGRGLRSWAVLTVPVCRTYLLILPSWFYSRLPSPLPSPLHTIYRSVILLQFFFFFL